MEERLRTSVRDDDMSRSVPPYELHERKPAEEEKKPAEEKKKPSFWKGSANDVRAIQRIVGAKVDGKYGLETRRKVAELKAHGLKADGLWGRETDNAYWQTQKMQRAPESEERQAISRGLMEGVDTAGRTDLLHGQRDSDFNRYTDRAPESDDEPSSDEHEPNFFEARDAEARKFKTFENGHAENFSKRRRRKELRSAGVDRRTARRQAEWENIANHAQREAERNGYERTPDTDENLEYKTKDGKKVYYHGRANGGSIDLAKLKFL